MQLLDGTDRHVIVAGDQGSEAHPARQQGRDGGRAAGGGPLTGGDQRLLHGNVLPGKGLAVAGEALHAGGGIRRARDEGDVAVPHPDQPLHHGRGGSLLIGVDAVRRVAPQPPVEHHDGLGVLLDELVNLLDAEKTRVDDDAVTAGVEQVLDGLSLLLGAVLAIGQDQLAAPIFGQPRRVGKQLAEIDAVIEGVGHHQAQSLGVFGGQLPGQQVGAIAALLYGLEHPIPGLLTGIAIARQHPGDSRLRHPCPLRHLQHSRHHLPLFSTGRSVLHGTRLC